MTKWARMRRRKEKRREQEASKSTEYEEQEIKLTEPEKDSGNANRFQEKQKLETPKISKPNSILAQIPRYVYLVAIFALVSGIFYPLITPGADVAFDFVIGGTVMLFVGLAGGILLFKAATSDNRRGIFMVAGFVLLAISLLLITQVQGWWQKAFF